jgi:hypothetical protein
VEAGLVKKWTILVIVCSVLGIAAYDVVPAFNKKKGDTISEVLLHASKKRPILACVWGILTGHLFWPQRERDGER